MASNQQPGEEPIEYELRLRLRSRPELRELLETLHRMRIELVRARQYAKRCTWQVPHPVHTHHVIRSIKQLESQIGAEIEGLGADPVEIDPPPTNHAQGGAAVMNSYTTTEIQKQQPGRFRNFLSATWDFVKKPQIVGAAAALAVVGVVYGVYRLITRDEVTEIVIQPSAANGPVAPVAPVATEPTDGGLVLSA